MYVYVCIFCISCIRMHIRMYIFLCCQRYHVISFSVWQLLGMGQCEAYVFVYTLMVVGCWWLHVYIRTYMRTSCHTKEAASKNMHFFTIRLYQNHPNAAKCTQMHPDVARCSQMQTDADTHAMYGTFLAVYTYIHPCVCTRHSCSTKV